MAYSTREMLARIADLFGAPASANPNQLYGNLVVSPNGNILVGTLTDDNIHKLQINGTTLLGGSGLVFPDASQQYSAAMGKNRVINPSGLIAQLGTSVVAGSGYTYGGVDRFVCANIGSQGAFTQSQAQLTFGGITRYGIMQKVNTAVSSFSAATVWSGIQQILEGYAVWDFVNQPFSLQFLFYTNVTGTFSAAVMDQGAAHSYVATFSATAGVPTIVQINFPANASLVIPQSTGIGMYLVIGALSGSGYITATPNTWLTSNTGVAPTATNWAAAVNNFIMVTDIQLELGPVCTSVERRLPQAELALVQRFVEQLTGQYGVGGVNSSTVAYMQVRFQPKRVQPTVFQNSAASTFYMWTATTGNQAPSALTMQAYGNGSAIATVTVTGAVAGQAAILENGTGGSFINVLSEY